MSGSDRPQLDAQHSTRLRALGARERPVYEWHAQLCAAVRGALGEEAARFFAEPVYDSSSGRIDWYAPISGEVVRLDGLDDETREAAEARIAALIESLNALQAQLETGEDAEGRRRGEILRMALSFPDKGQIYLVGSQPVVVNWGFVAEGRDAPFMPLFRQGAPLPRRSMLAGSGARLAFPWWIWPLLLLLLAALAFQYCGGGLPGPFGAPGIGPPSGPIAGADEARQLRARLAELRRQYAARLAACEPLAQADPRRRRVGPGGRAWIDERTGKPILPSDITDLSELPPELQEQLRDPQTGELPTLEELLADPDLALADPNLGFADPNLGFADPDLGIGELDDPNMGGTGLDALAEALPDPLLDDPLAPSEEPGAGEPGAEEPGAEPPGAEGAPEEPAGEPLSMPENLKPGQVPGFLAGRWRSKTPLAERSMSPGENVEMNYDFDENGEGRIDLKHTDGTACTARARASVREQDKLRIESLEKARCSDGESYGKLQVDCARAANGEVECTADQGDGRRFRVDLRR